MYLLCMFWGGHVWRPEDKLEESGLSFRYAHPRGFRLASKHLSIKPALQPMKRSF